MLHNTAITIMCAFRDIRYHVDVTSTPVTLIVPYINAVFRWRTQSVDIGGHVAGSVKRKHPVEIITSSHHIGRIRLGNFVEHFQFVEHISYSTGTSRNSVENKRCQEKCL